jgi:UDP:flavonoid glycosyltransferase YjiC (YdhE family)
MMARIVLNTFGSFGDLHPFLALAIELKRRGHKALIATSQVYRAKVQAENIEFASVRPDVGGLIDDAEMLRKLWDPRHGTEYLLRDVILPPIEQSYEDLERACQGAELLVTHTAAPAGPIVAEAKRLCWLSAVLQPAAFLSTYDSPVLAQGPWLKKLDRFGRWPFRAALALGKQRTRHWMRPVFALRKRLGLPPGKMPMMQAQFSPEGTLALFSRHFAAPQPDWPPHVTTAGFVYYDKRGPFFEASASRMATELSDFLASGPPPIVFTLGSSAVMQPGTFFHESLHAAHVLRQRAVLLTGPGGADQLGPELPDSACVVEYAPYSELLPHASVVVHQGGIGTTAQALRAGVPTLVVPWAHDQPDNAYRLRKLGVSRTLDRKHYTAANAAREIRPLLEQPDYATSARTLNEQLLAEDGLKTACDAIQRHLN